jgi:lysophospholipase L1-like esterase
MKSKQLKLMFLFVLLALLIPAYMLKSTLLVVASAIGLLLLLTHWYFKVPAGPLVSFFIGLVSLEVGLRTTTDNYRTYLERIGVGYVSMSKVWIDDYFFRHPPNWKYDREQPEFSYQFETNSLGIFAQEPQDIDTNKRVILCLGDSFTEGVGAPQDSSWPAGLQRRLDSAFPDSFEVVNAGIGGSDIFFEWKLYEDLLKKSYKVDEVIFFVGDSDLEDVFTRLGDDRFQPNGTVRFREAPRWEVLYKYSFIFRFIIMDILGYGYNLVKTEVYHTGLKRSCELITKKIVQVADELKKDGVVLSFYIHPQPNELEIGTYNSDCFKSIAKSDLPVIDFLQEKERFKVALPNNYHKLYWPVDGHFTSKGYDFLAEVISMRYTQGHSVSEGKKVPSN